jgi:hypothetical protein
MSDQEKSKDLELAFEHIAALHITLAALMTDFAALRRVVLKDCKTSNRYRRVLACEVAKAKPLVGQAIQAYRDQIASISATGQFKN